MQSNPDSPSPLNEMGLNELQTLLRQAVQRQDFREAGILSDELLIRISGGHPPTSEEETKARRRRMSWKGLGSAPWLVERLDSLNYTFPTTIQINSMEAVNAILNTTDEMIQDTSLEKRIELNDKDMGIVVSGSTGSGKTLSYLVPLLSTLSDSLFVRQRLRVGAEENVGDTTDDLLERVAVVTSPVIRSNARKQIRRGGAIATGAALSTLGKSGSDVKSPLAIVVVPTRELGVQIAMLLYQLVGGNVKKSETELAGKSNMFRYKGPKGIKIGCILDDEEAEFGLKLQTDVAITMPQYLTKLIADGDVIPSKLRVVAYDEADLGLEQTEANVLSSLFDDDPEDRDYSRLTFLVGASVTEALGNLAVRSRVLPRGKSYIATATRFAPLESYDPITDMDGDERSMVDATETATASLKDLNICLDPGLKHERVVAPEGAGLLYLTRLLRKELQDYESAVARGANTTEIQRPRVVVFFPSEEEAQKSIEAVRDAMWGQHQVCVLLPKTGVRPLSMMEQFKEGKMSVMLATPNSVRGLDFPALTHVYTLYLPIDDPREYVHLAGRVGRIGQTGSVRGTGGRVVSILREEEAGKMEDLARELQFEFIDVEPVGESFDRTEDGSIDLEKVDVDKARRLLEDTLTLVSLSDDDKEEESVDSLQLDVVDAEIVEHDDDDDLPYQ
jgi:superfamily II DNA/RNA helicase